MPKDLSRKELRDYFAAEAMNGLVAGTQVRLTEDTNTLTQRAFDIADAMLVESDHRKVPLLEISDPGHFAAC